MDHACSMNRTGHVKRSHNCIPYFHLATMSFVCSFLSSSHSHYYFSASRYQVLNWSRKINQETLHIFQTAVDENHSAGLIYPSCRESTSPWDLKFLKNSPIFCLLFVLRSGFFPRTIILISYFPLHCIKNFILFFFSLLHCIITCLKWKSWNIHSVPLHRCRLSCCVFLVSSDWCLILLWKE